MVCVGIISGKINNERLIYHTISQFYDKEQKNFIYLARDIISLHDSLEDFYGSQIFRSRYKIIKNLMLNLKSILKT